MGTAILLQTKMKRQDVLLLLLLSPFIPDRAEASRAAGNVALSMGRTLRGGGASSSSSNSATSASWKPPVTTIGQRQPGKSSNTVNGQQRWEFNQQQQQMSRTEVKEELDSFLTRDSRNSFVARVYAILSCQLLVTAAAVVLFGTQPLLSAWMRRPGLGASVPMLSLLLSTIAWFVMCASPQARRKSPAKYQWLTLFTLGEAISVGFISSFYQFRSVVSALMATALAATGVSLYTANQQNPQYDLSQWGAGLSSCGLVFLVYGVIQLLQMTGVLPANFLPYNDKIYGLVGACLFSIYLAYHTKLIVAGKHSKYQMNEKDYVYGAMTLYNDIINLFIYTLRLIGEDREDR